MIIIDRVDQLRQIDCLCGLEMPEQVNMLKISWGRELVFLAAILIGFTIHANELPLSLNSLNLFGSVIISLYTNTTLVCQDN